MATYPFSFAPNAGLTAKFKQLLAKVAANRPQDDLEIIRKAYEFSLKHHAGQTRASGEPYLIHPLEVAMVLTDLKLDSTAIAAGRCMMPLKTHRSQTTISGANLATR